MDNTLLTVNEIMKLTGIKSVSGAIRFCVRQGWEPEKFVTRNGHKNVYRKTEEDVLNAYEQTRKRRKIKSEKTANQLSREYEIKEEAQRSLTRNLVCLTSAWGAKRKG